MAKIGDTVRRAKNKNDGFSVFDDTTPPRSEAADPPGPVPAATFQPPAPAEPVLSGKVVERPALPEPHDPLGDGELTDREREELEMCEAAIRDAQKSFITRGRGMHVIRDGRLYRTYGYTNFDDYLRDHWDTTRQEVSRDILAYPLGERLSQICDKINRDQVLKLKPVADRYGDDAAVTVYKTVAEAKGGKATAALLRGAVGAVPEDGWNERQAVERIRAYLEGEFRPAISAPNPGEQVEKLLATISRIKVDRLRTADPATRQEVAAKLRELAERLEAGE